MRSEEEIKKLIIDYAKSDERIRAVLLNGSRANDKVMADQYQDFDIVYIVKELRSSINDTGWMDVFGERIIMQLPDEMVIDEHNEDSYSYLILFKDGNRIDFTLYPVEKVQKNYWPDSLTIGLLDKDDLFNNLPTPTDKDYWIKTPTEKEFLDTCNEFWWVCTYVAKGLLRDQVPYAKQMLETTVRPMFMKVIEWYIGFKTNFSVSFGSGGKFMSQYLTARQYKSVLATYSDHHIESNWKSLLLTAELFSEFAIKVAGYFNFQYNFSEQENVMEYLRKMRNMDTRIG